MSLSWYNLVFAKHIQRQQDAKERAEKADIEWKRDLANRNYELQMKKHLDSMAKQEADRLQREAAEKAREDRHKKDLEFRREKLNQESELAKIRDKRADKRDAATKDYREKQLALRTQSQAAEDQKRRMDLTLKGINPDTGQPLSPDQVTPEMLELIRRTNAGKFPSHVPKYTEGHILPESYSLLKKGTAGKDEETTSGLTTRQVKLMGDIISDQAKAEGQATAEYNRLLKPLIKEGDKKGQVRAKREYQERLNAIRRAFQSKGDYYRDEFYPPEEISATDIRGYVPKISTIPADQREQFLSVVRDKIKKNMKNYTGPEKKEVAEAMQDLEEEASRPEVEEEIPGSDFWITGGPEQQVQPPPPQQQQAPVSELPPPGLPSPEVPPAKIANDVKMHFERMGTPEQRDNFLMMAALRTQESYEAGAISPEEYVSIIGEIEALQKHSHKMANPQQAVELGPSIVEQQQLKDSQAGIGAQGPDMAQPGAQGLQAAMQIYESLYSQQGPKEASNTVIEQAKQLFAAGTIDKAQFERILDALVERLKKEE